jgi:gluconate:H+ symporter, GntP family
MNPFIICGFGIATVLVCIIVLRLHAFLSLLIAALVTGLLTTQTQILSYGLHNNMAEAAAKALSAKNIGTRLADALGNTVSKIGILIALASIIGSALMRSGGAERIVRSLIKLIGAKNTDLALITSSFTLGIPVFFDTVFYLLIPIVKSAGVRDPKKYSLYLMCAIAGAVMTHSLVPPTPGPLFVAKELKVDMGVMMIWGIIVGAVTVAFGYAYARWANQKWDLPMRDTADISVESLRQTADTKEADLPNLWLSLLPIVLPILLITGNTVLEMLIKPNDPSVTEAQKTLLWTFKLIGDSNIALFIATAFALFLLWKRVENAAEFEKTVNESLTSAGTIILITSAGGVFGQMLQQTDIGDAIGSVAKNYQAAILPLAFFITLIVRTAQGSATVAMVTAIGILSGIGGANGFGFHPVYLAIAIGCGSKIFPWMNDSGFWVVTKMSGMDTAEGIRFFSFLLTLMGFAGLITVMILAYLFPMV